MSTSKERFEAWAKKETNIPLDHDVHEPEEYRFVAATDAYNAFQAAERAAVRRCIEIARTRSPDGRPCLFEQDAQKEFPEHFEE